jgi:2'-5' RNA ligase
VNPSSAQNAHKSLNTTRIFIGFKCPPLEDLVHLILKLKRQSAHLKTRWTLPESWHITSHFIGPVPTDAIELYKESIRHTAANYKSFSTEVYQLGLFPDTNRPRILWAGLSKTEDLRNVYDTLGDQLKLRSYTMPEKPYHPHITIARFKTTIYFAPIQEALLNYQYHSFGTIQIKEITLFESRLHAHGPVYLPIYSAPLK